MINLKKIYYIMYILFVLFNYFFCFLFKFPIRISHLNCYKGKYGLLIIVIISFMLFMYQSKLKINWDTPAKLILALLTIVSINAVFSWIRYTDMKIVSVIRALYPFFICLLYFPLHKTFRNSAKKENFIKILTVINIIAIIIISVQALLYNKYGILFISVYEFTLTDTVALRNGNFRMTYLDTMLLLSFTVSLGYSMENHKGNKLHMLNLILSFAYIYYISQTRSEIIICFALIILLLLKKYNMKKKLSNIYRSIAVFGLVLVLVIYNSEAIKYKFESVSATSLNTRLDEIVFYFNLFKENLLVGVGVFEPLRGEQYYEILHGNSWRYSVTDIGLLGQCARMGIQILVWYGAFLVYLYKNAKGKNTFLFVYILLSSINLIVLDNQRIITIPIILALISSSGNLLCIKEEIL